MDCGGKDRQVRSYPMRYSVKDVGVQCSGSIGKVTLDLARPLKDEPLLVVE